jgi:hypothetical protein
MAERAAKLSETSSTRVQADSELDVERVCEALFDQTSMSSEITALFDEQYRNATVRWTGTLTSVRSYTFDLVFGSEPGVRAVFDIHQSSGESFSGRSVQAVVQFPADLEDSLRARHERELTFEGTLVSCDAFMKNLFVGGGKLV